MARTEDNRFVDHVESKLLSPTKESWTPSKGFQSSTEQSKQPDTTHNKNNSASLNDDLDSGNNVEVTLSNGDHGNGHYVDRQECLIEAGDPDVIKSPNKVVDSVFSFINAEAESLDAVNNNSELAMQCSDQDGEDTTDIDNANHEANQYLGKEVILHKNVSKSLNKISEEPGAAKTNGPSEDDASVNLYWYSTNLDIDQTELEAFKKSQNDGTVTSTLNKPFQDGYYKGKLGDLERLEVQDSEMITTLKKSEDHETWSQAFGSASSHCLDVASALISEPKSKKNKENTSIKETGSNHPWGLQNDDKVIEIPESTNELPSIVSELSVGPRCMDLDKVDATCHVELKDSEAIQKQMFKTEMQMNVRKSVSDADLDESDAVGYMEFKDKEEILNKTGQPKDSYMNKNNDQSNNVRNTKGKKRSSKVVKDAVELDDCDAVGYMELKDKDDFLQGMTDRKANSRTDEVDATGYMELKDKPVEEMISSSDNKVVYSENNFSSISIETTEIYAHNVSKQIVTNVTKHFDKDIDNDADDEDSPDGSGKLVEEFMERKTEKVTKTRAQPEEIYLSQPVEIRRKFKLSNDTEKKIKEMGGHLIEKQLIVDEYLDDSSYSILLHDCWLRLRNKQFQMKLNSKPDGERNLYPESDMESKINEALNSIFVNKYHGKAVDKPLDVLIDELGLTEFVTIEITRKTYKVDDCIIELDLASLGPDVGDIIVVIDKPSDMVSGLQQLDQIANMIGMHPLHSA